MSDIELRQLALEFSMNRNAHNGRVQDVIKEAQILLGYSKEKKK